MNFFDTRALQKHAMKCRYGVLRFLMFGYVDADIKKHVNETTFRVTNKDGEFDEHQARLDYWRAYPIKD